MALELYLSNNTTLASALVFEAPGGGPVQAGADSAVLTVHLWNSKGDSGAATAHGVVLEMQSLLSGSWVASGTAAQDELWGRARIVGQTRTAHPEQSIELTDWVPLGNGGRLFIGSVFGNCAVHIEIKLHPASTAAAAPVSLRFLPVAQGHVVAVPAVWAAVAGGLLPGVGERGVSALLRGGAVTASGTADDEVHVAALYALRQGRPVGWLGVALECNQQDGAAAALAAGQSYLAAVSVGPSGPRLTKGLKGAAPVRPSVPAGDVRLAWVEVAYNASASVVEAADITADAAVDRCPVRAGAGLAVEVGPGRVLWGATFRVRAAWAEVAVPASATRYLFQDGQGEFLVSASAEPSAAGEFGPLAKVVTDGTGVTSLVDLRTYAGRPAVLSLARVAWSPAVGAVSTRRVAAARVWLEVAALRLSAAPGTGSPYRFDVLVNGTTIYTGSGTDDQRPTVAAGATGAALVHDSGVPEVLELRRGDVVTLQCVAVPTSPSAVDVEIDLVGWEV